VLRACTITVAPELWIRRAGQFNEAFSRGFEPSVGSGLAPSRSRGLVTGRSRLRRTAKASHLQLFC
jgi:hypothetical protein